MLCLSHQGNPIRRAVWDLPNSGTLAQPSYLDSIAFMPRNPTQRELIVDFFDDDIAYAYAYAYQSTLNRHLDALSKLAHDVLDHAHDTEMLQDLPHEALDGIEHGVMNMLQAAVMRRAVSSETKASEWLNSPLSFGFRLFLNDLNNNPHTAWLFMQQVYTWLEKKIPNEIKPFTTIRQVHAIVQQVAESEKALYDTPLHFPSLAQAIHTAFIRIYSSHSKELDPGKPLRDALDQYRRAAYSAGTNVFIDAFTKKMVSIMYTEATQLDLTIDRYYSWGALIVKPVRALNLLSEFAALISKDVEWYGKWKPEVATAELPNISAEDFIINRLRFGVRVLPQSTTTQIYFSTDHSEIKVNDNPLQNCLILALPFDRPNPEMNQVLLSFRNYFARRAARYRSDIQDPGAREVESITRAQTIIPEVKERRLILKDVRSIPSHLAALRTFESDKPEEKSKPITSLYLNIHQEFLTRGFKLSSEVIRSAVQDAVKHQNEVIENIKYKY